MKPWQVRDLTVGDRIRWQRTATVEVGVIKERRLFGVIVEWSDGRTTEMFFNEMKNVEREAPAP
ncbi:hypothetical protein [Bradyrhizobium sp. BR13661]|jgi:hypothetical protein|uniref:hypothetical protein n=1 Tax=Bradyrhizobium sp. BR13661 TaxID=2940622 RepID=UPI002475F1EB|nr:hypothetical protein [Bradyrhizobium sp. BR13661]